MLKRILLVSVMSFGLTACETMGDMSWPTLPEMPSISSINLFESDDQYVASSLEDNKELFSQDVSASDIELSEMEKLTGYRQQPKPRVPVMNIIDDLSTMDDETVMETLPAAPTPIVKVEKLDSLEQVKGAEAGVETVNIAKENVDVPVVVTQDKDASVNVVDIAAKSVEVKKEIEKAKDLKEINDSDPSLLLSVSNDPQRHNSVKEDQVQNTMIATCPMVEIMPVAKSMTNFNKDMAGKMTSRATINEVRGGCEFVDGGMEIDLDILMTGQITNAGRDDNDRKNEEFVSFPYFIYALGPDKKAIDKDILSSIIHFRPMVDQSKHAEKITQFIAMNDKQNAGNYKIIVGYQLSKQQLEYNRASVNQKDKAQLPTSRDVLPSRRISTNPL